MIGHAVAVRGPDRSSVKWGIVGDRCTRTRGNVERPDILVARLWNDPLNGYFGAVRRQCRVEVTTRCAHLGQNLPLPVEYRDLLQGRLVRHGDHEAFPVAANIGRPRNDGHGLRQAE